MDKNSKDNININNKKKKYILVIDQGTTSTRAIIFDKNGNIVSKAQEDFKQIYPQVGYVEHDPLDILSSTMSVVSTSIIRAKIKYSDIHSLGITNQRESIILWNKTTGEPIYNCIVWQCRRTSDYCEQLIKDGYQDFIYSKTGLKIDPYFSATKIKWIFDNVESAKELADSNNLCIGTIDTYLMYHFSSFKIFATDVTNASRTMLFNIYENRWDEELCKLFNIPMNALPEVHPSGYYFGDTDDDVFGASIPICGVAGDQQSALFGQLCINKKQLKVTYGTGCFLLMNTGSTPITSKNGLLTTVCCQQQNDPISYCLEGSVFIGGAVIQWLRDELGLIKNADESEEYALKVKDTNGLVIVPSFVGLGAPYWDSSSLGMICNITRGTNKYHLVRAALESICFQVYDIVKAMERDSDTTISEIKVDGGACVNNFLLQFQSDILQKQINRHKNVEVTALGVCYLAGLTSSFWTSIDELKDLNKVEREFIPSLDNSKRVKLLEEYHKAVKKVLTK